MNGGGENFSVTLIALSPEDVADSLSREGELIGRQICLDGHYRTPVATQLIEFLSCAW